VEEEEEEEEEEDDDDDDDKAVLNYGFYSSQYGNGRENSTKI
jgi:hypothetical protein